MNDAIHNDDSAIKPQGDAATSSGSVTVGGNVDGNIIVGSNNTIVNQYAASRESFLHQLPAPSQDFTGRKTELDELAKAIDRGVTISGVQGQGGVGKSQSCHGEERSFDFAQDKSSR